MGGFLSFVKKEALHIVRDPRTMLIVLLMPVVQVLLFGFAMNTEVSPVPLPRSQTTAPAGMRLPRSSSSSSFTGFGPIISA